MAQNLNPEGFVLGNELFLFDGSTNKPFAYATECSLSLSSEQISTANKMSGNWTTGLPGQISWTMSVSALYTAAQGSVGYKNLYDAMANRETIKVNFGVVDGYNEISDYTDPDEYVLDSAAGYYQGYAYISSLELTAGNGEVASYSVELTGNGKLEHKNA